MSFDNLTKSSNNKKMGILLADLKNRYNLINHLDRDLAITQLVSNIDLSTYHMEDKDSSLQVGGFAVLSPVNFDKNKNDTYNALSSLEESKRAAVWDEIFEGLDNTSCDKLVGLAYAVDILPKEIRLSAITKMSVVDEPTVILICVGMLHKFFPNVSSEQFLVKLAKNNNQRIKISMAENLHLFRKSERYAIFCALGENADNKTKIALAHNIFRLDRFDRFIGLKLLSKDACNMVKTALIDQLYLLDPKQCYEWLKQEIELADNCFKKLIAENLYRLARKDFITLFAQLAKEADKDLIDVLTASLQDLSKTDRPDCYKALIAC